MITLLFRELVSWCLADGDRGAGRNHAHPDAGSTLLRGEQANIPGAAVNRRQQAGYAGCCAGIERRIIALIVFVVVAAVGVVFFKESGCGVFPRRGRRRIE
jgi:hypothetical protein